MSRWRVGLVAALIAVPILGWAAIGSYYLWINGWAFWAWWPLMGMMTLGYLLAWYWQRRKQLLRPPNFEAPPHWTERDHRAFQLVEQRARNAEKVAPEKLADPGYYWQTAQEMAKELAGFYHPGTQDPIDNLTVPEVLAVIELAAHDLSVLVEQHLPGGHLLTIRDWKRAKQIQQWYETGSNLWWTISALFNPMQTALRYTASQLGVSTPLRLLQQDLFLWFHTAFVHRLGTYLIDLNSGRLRVGATRYREMIEKLRAQEQQTLSVAEKQALGPLPAGESSGDAGEQVQQITITVIGQVKAGKSSLINAFLGEQRANTGVLPTTEGIERYELLAPGIPTRLVLLDSVGYGHEGPRPDKVQATMTSVQQSDLVFLVLHARSPGRQADLDMLNQLRGWFEQRPDLRAPPVITVLTHIDLLSPAMEWAPPYNWVKGMRPKEVNIRQAVATVREQFGEHLVSVVPVCAAPGKEYGIDEELLPSIANWLDEVRGVALLRCLKAEADQERITKVFRQLLASGKLVAEKVWEKATGS